LNKKGLALAVILVLGASVFVYPTQYAAADDLMIKEECTSEGWVVTITDPEGNPLNNVRVITLKKMSASSPEESFFTDKMGVVLVPFSSITGFVQLSKGGYNDHKLSISCNPPTGYTGKVESGFFRYDDTLHGIKMDYPSNWKIDKSDPNLRVMLISPQESNSDLYLETVAIVAVEVDVDNPADLAKSYLSFTSTNLQGFQLLENTPDVIGNHSAQKAVFIGGSQGVTAKVLVYFTMVDGIGYVFVFDAEPTKYPSYLPVFEQMIGSIVIDREGIPTEFSGKYIDKKIGLEFQFPQGWKGVKLKQDDMYIASAMSDVPTKSYSSEINPNFAMMTVVTGDLDKMLEIPEPECDTPYPPAKILELNGMKAVEFTGKCLEPTMNAKLKMTGYLIATNNDFIDIGYASGSDETFEKEISKFHESLETLKISNAVDISEPSNYAKTFGLMLDKKSIKFDDQILEIDIATSSTITDFSFNAQNEKISFGVLEQSETGITEIFISKVLEPPYTITIDEKSIDDFTITNDETTGEIIVSFDYEHPVKQVVIEGKIISDNPSSIQEKDSTQSQIPDWIRNNASWWVAGNIDDDAFVGGIQFLIKEGIIQIPETAQSTTGGSQGIPAWIKNNADWWSQGSISDNDFLKGIQFLVENGIIII